MKYLKQLSETPGIPGQESKIRDIIREELGPYVEEIETDVLGNLICIRKGTGEGPRVLVAAHMDEIGFMVRAIEEESGFLRIEPVGGFDPRLLLAQRVFVHGQEGTYPGVIGTKPIHLLEKEDTKKVPEIKDLFVDVGMAKDRVKDSISIGDPITLQQNFTELGDLVTGKALDDRVGIYTAIEAIKKVNSKYPQHRADIVFVGTTQEEIGLKGATVSGYTVEPDIAVAVDVTVALDIPDVEERDTVTTLGDGVGIKIKDSSSISNPKLVRKLKEIGDNNSIPYQMEILPRGGTDAGAIQLSKSGVAAITLSVPTRYVHSVVESAAKSDIQAGIDLLAEFLATCHEDEYTL